MKAPATSSSTPPPFVILAGGLATRMGELTRDLPKALLPVAGRPFVGPAGQLFDAALAEAGVDRSRAYVTNAVKHFKFVRQGKQRLHQSPDAGEIQACRWWLGQEIDLIRPRVVVALGASAARAMLGKAVTISRTRGSAIG